MLHRDRPVWQAVVAPEPAERDLQTVEVAVEDMVAADKQAAYSPVGKQAVGMVVDTYRLAQPSQL